MHLVAGFTTVLLALGLTTTVAAATSGASTLPLRSEARPAAELRSCGISLTNEALVAFLQRGVPDVSALPEEPQEKCQLIIDAMAKLAEAKAKEAVLTLQQIASVDPPAGVLQMLEHDLGRTAPEGREEFKNRALRLLQYNAVNALSLIGDKNSTQLIRSVSKSETNAAARIQYAICLASLGDASGVGDLVAVIQRENRRESAAAARAFMIITGQDFGYSENTPLRARKARAAMYSQWWRSNAKDFQVDVAAMNQRRQQPYTTAQYQPRNTRDLLKLASNYFDFGNATKALEARKALKDSGTSINGELERIAQDANEDLNVRMEAMNWYYESNRAQAKSLMKRLRRDENPEIADKANVLLEQIEEDLNPPTAQQVNR
ncbi:MAG: hypothetical protein ACR2IE_15045 [Candidatus Sumerlaeaceae bacterium]